VTFKINRNDVLRVSGQQASDAADVEAMERTTGSHLNDHQFSMINFVVAALICE